MSVSSSIMCNFDFVTHHYRSSPLVEFLLTLDSWVNPPSHQDLRALKSEVWSHQHDLHSGCFSVCSHVRFLTCISEAFQLYPYIWYRNECNNSASSIHSSNCGWQMIFHETLLRQYKSAKYTFGARPRRMSAWTSSLVLPDGDSRCATKFNFFCILDVITACFSTNGTAVTS